MPHISSILFVVTSSRDSFLIVKVSQDGSAAIVVVTAGKQSEDAARWVLRVGAATMLFLHILSKQWENDGNSYHIAATLVRAIGRLLVL